MTSQDVVDFSGQKLEEVPRMKKESIITDLDISKNLLHDINGINYFSSLQYVNLSRNKLTDISLLVEIPSLVEIDISHNLISEINCLSSLSSLKICNASFNKISTINTKMPTNMVEMDLSDNNISNLDFLQTTFSNKIRIFNLRNNNITEIRALRFLAVFTELRVLDIGMLESNRNLKILPFIKHLCPNLDSFDGAPCNELMESEPFNSDELFDILLNGSETELKALLATQGTSIIWEEPQFVPFDDEIPMTPLKGIEDRLRRIEEKIPEEENKRKTKLENYITRDEADAIRDEIAELRDQITQLTQLLFVHDAAMKQVWESLR